jgi:predicted Zn-dependent protease
MLLSTIDEERQRTVIVSHFYQKGRDVFAFHGMTSESGYASLKDLLQWSATGFQGMTDPARLNRQPRRIAVEPVTRATTLEHFLQSRQVDPEFWNRIAWLNGWPLSARLAVGERVKVIR